MTREQLLKEKLLQVRLNVQIKRNEELSRENAQLKHQVKRGQENRAKLVELISLGEYCCTNLLGGECEHTRRRANERIQSGNGP